MSHCGNFFWRLSEHTSVRSSLSLHMSILSGTTNQTALRTKADFPIRCAQCFRHPRNMPLQTRLPHPLNDGSERCVRTFNESLENFSFPRQNMRNLAYRKIFFFF